MGQHAATGPPRRAIAREFETSRWAEEWLARAYELLLPRPDRPAPPAEVGPPGALPPAKGEAAA